ncbi:MAG: hypothetical protein WAO69_14265 [Aestuariivita sp.]|uniref:hypothetical protein n=1 Tax=Aestuariivita sp. TaxID=1872407 RepID=UPI003BAF7401
MTTYSKAKANLLWARVLLAKEEGFGPGQGFRYDIADFVQEAWPEKGVPALIPVSVEARKHQEAGIKTRYEHSVPLGVLFKMMLETDTVEEMVDVIERHYQTAFVTIEEDKRINALGYRSKMPADWDGNIMARYDAAGIQF